MRHLEASGVVLDSRLSVEEIRERQTLVAVEIRGRVHCADGVTAEVDKTLQARGRPDGRSEVLGVHYRYHAWWERAGVTRDLLRYDSAPHPGFDGRTVTCSTPRRDARWSWMPSSEPLCQRSIR